MATRAKTTTSTESIPVTTDNFVRAETDWVFAGLEKTGAFGKFHHYRDLAPVDDTQVVPRGNRDTLYSIAVFDLDAGPVTVTLPEADKRFMTMMVVDEDHYVLEVVYGAGGHTYTKEHGGTRYLLTAVRTFVDPNDPKDIEEVRALQDALKIDQKGPGKLEIPAWDKASQEKVRGALKVLGESLPDLKGAFGSKGGVDQVRHLIATATAWGGNPDKDAVYLNITPSKNDGKTIYKLSVKDVPVDGFWSITLYNAEGYLQKNDQDHYSFNNITAEKDPDGSVTVQFGGCDGKAANCLPIMSGWNYMVRLYRPQKKILDGTYKFPEAQPVS